MSTRHPSSIRGRVLKALGLLYAVMWAGGVIAYVWRGGVAPHEEWTAPAFLLLAGMLVLVAAAPRARLVLLATAAVGFAAECVGVRYDWPFGAYSYTDRLFPSVNGVPVVMASAWLVLVAYVRWRVSLTVSSRTAKVLLSAGWLTAIDLVIDPVAAGPLAYWTWTEGGTYYGVPWSNFAGWFGVGIAAFATAAALDRQPPDAFRASTERARPDDEGAVAARVVGLSIVLFFTILAAAFGQVLPAGVGLLLGLADLAVARRPSSAGAFQLPRLDRSRG